MFGPMEILKNNTKNKYNTMEDIYYENIENKNSEIKFIDYYLKRNV